MYQAFGCGFFRPLAGMGMRGPGANHICELLGSMVLIAFPAPDLTDHLSLPFIDLLTRPTFRGAASSGGGLFGMFSEGGYSNAPVSFWSGAPHLSEGSPNVGSGIRAILHDNEAVVPLSRGRSVPVDMSNAPTQSAGDTHYHMNTKVVAKDADLFRQSSA